MVSGQLMSAAGLGIFLAIGVIESGDADDWFCVACHIFGGLA